MFEILYFTTHNYIIVSTMSLKYSYLLLHNYSKYNMVEILYLVKHNYKIVSTIFLKYYFFSATQLYKSKYNMFEILYFTTQDYTTVSTMSLKYSYLLLHNYTSTINYNKCNMVEILYFTKHNYTIVSTIFLNYFFPCFTIIQEQLQCVWNLVSLHTQFHNSKHNNFKIFIFSAT